jgi:hypothetical protein
MSSAETQQEELQISGNEICSVIDSAIAPDFEIYEKLLLHEMLRLLEKLLLCCPYNSLPPYLKSKVMMFFSVSNYLKPVEKSCP